VGHRGLGIFFAAVGYMLKIGDATLLFRCL
jgi:hypothetical protein